MGLSTPRCCYLSRVFVLFGSAPVIVSGFTLEHIFRPMSIKPDLIQLTDTQHDQLLNIQLHIGEEEGPRMAVADMVIELHHESAEYDHTTLPGADGEHQNLSTGHRRLDIVTGGQYIDHLGTQQVRMNKGCWEMCWREDKPAGTLICGFDLPEEYRRNEAVLPKGELYISFPLWTQEGLKIGQEEKRKTEQVADRFLEECDAALDDFEMTDNPIMKAIHIQKAHHATDRYNDIDHDTLATIPMDHQVFQIQDDLLLTVKGLIWTKDWETKQGGGHILLGYATVTPKESNTFSSSRLMP